MVHGNHFGHSLWWITQGGNQDVQPRSILSFTPSFCCFGLDSNEPRSNVESNYFQKNIESLKIEESNNKLNTFFCFQSVFYIQRFLNQTNQLIPRVSDVGLGQDAITMGSMLRLYGGAFFSNRNPRQVEIYQLQSPQF